MKATKQELIDFANWYNDNHFSKGSLSNEDIVDMYLTKEEN